MKNKNIKRTFHPQLSDDAVLRRVEIAKRQDSQEIDFTIPLAKKKFKIITNSKNFGNHKVYQSEFGSFVIFKI